MKTNRIARQVVQAKNTLLVIAMIGLAGLSYQSGQLLERQIAKTAMPHDSAPQAPTVSFDRLMASMK